MMAELTQRMVDHAASSLDDRLKAGIIRTIGDDWTLGSLRGRLMAITYAGKPYTDYAIDGRTFLRAWPGEMVWEGTKATWKQNYQDLS
jgi:hypothetical protein